ncbi:MAG TPA: M20 family metallopeptidase [Holophaga sp.]|nr:M20 family metallopeptidase [Holophaga sp.]
MITDDVRALSDQHFHRMMEVRHELHRFPELAYQEFRTSRLVADVLASAGIAHRTGIASTGVVGLIPGRGPGKTVLLRADMDALPVTEEADVPYRSEVPGRMHACGHDGHVAGVLGAAMILNGLRDRFDGNVKLAFQPAEEAEGGASRMIQEGLLEDPHVDAAFGCHLWGSLAQGTMHICPGPMMAAVDTFLFRIHGRGGHGAMPHLSVDPVTLAAQVVTFMQTIVSRRIDPLEPAVLTIASIHGGNAYNVIPEVVEVQGTIRTFNEALRQVVLHEMESILKSITEAQGATYSFELVTSYPAVHNDPAMTDIVSGAFRKVLGEACVDTRMAPIMVSEDFSYFTQAVPSAFAFVGIAKDVSRPVNQHHPKFQWDDRNIAVLAQGLAQTALDFLEG